MALDVLMPIISDEGDDAVVTAWMVDDGSRVKAGQLIAEVQSEKVAVDVEAPADGIVKGMVSINQPVPQGSPICRLEEVAEDDAGPERLSDGPGGDTTAGPSKPGNGVASAPAPASPAARRLARELGVDLAGIEGSGPGGRVTEADVRGASGRQGATEMEGLRAVIARNMRQSHATTAPVTLTTTADVTGRLPEHITAWLLRAAAVALEEHPDLNGVREGDSFRPAGTTAISLAIQTDAGLVAPVVRDPSAGSLAELADRIAALAERARSRGLTNDDFEGGTFSVTNLGAYGIDGFTPIINLPQVAILGVGAVRTLPGFADGEVSPREQMTLSLTFDHAFVDGAPAAAFLARLRQELETG